MGHDRKSFDFFSVKAVLVTAPLQSLLVQVGDINELTPCNEIFLDEPDKTLYLAFRKRMPRLS